METFARFTVGGQDVYGMLHIPGTDRPPAGFPSVVLLHGYTGNTAGDHRLLPLLSRHLITLGIASLRFDFRGSGGSQGDFSEMTVSREIEDVHAAFGWLRGQDGIDPENISLLGFSMGGMVAALSAPDLAPMRLALWAPALPELWLQNMPDARVLPEVVDANGWPLGRGFVEELPDLDPLGTVARYGGPAQVFHGTEDTAVPPAVGQQYADALKAELVPIPGANHTFDSLEAVRTLYAATGEFLSET